MLALVLFALLPLFPLYAGIASLVLFRWPFKKPRTKLFNALLFACALLLLATQFAPQLFLNPLKPGLVANDNLILNSEAIANWSQPPGIKAFQTLAKEAFSENVSADCIDLLPSPNTYAVEYAYQQPRGLELQGSIYVKALSESRGQSLGLRLILGATEGKVIYQQESFVLHETWQRIRVQHQFDTPADSISAALLLYNPATDKSLSFCAWGALLTEGSSEQDYQPYAAQLELPTSSWPKRGGNSLFIILNFFIILIAIEHSKRLCSLVPEQKAFVLLGISTLALAMLGILQKSSLFSPALARARGLSFHPNLYSAELVFLSLILSVYFKSRTLNALLIPITFLALWSAGSRGAFVAYSIGLSIYYLVRLPRSKFLLLMGTMLLLTAALFGWAPDLLGRIADFSDHNHSRQDLLRAALAIGLERPLFGWGLGSVPSQLIRALWTANPEIYAHAHNIFSQILIEFGLLGLFAFVWVARAFILDLRASGQVFLALPLLAVLINNQFDVLISQPALYIPVFVWLGFIYHRATLARG